MGSVKESSYRRPGARMLVCEAGISTGGKSSQGEFCRHASSENHTQTMFQKKNRL
ncbi:XdhC family protein [Scytonema sp. PCC 10023]|uniref:XdhC family protein n=1 Tax=Scytonema sp. PCC 10023 TaxID=1680591 RepID=UPI0039C6751B